jgi:hypothetical protein
MGRLEFRTDTLVALNDPGRLHSAGDQWRRRGVRKILHSGPDGRSPKGSETIRPIPQNTAIASGVSAPNRVLGAWACTLAVAAKLGLGENVCLLAIVSSGIRRAYVRPCSRDDGPALQKNFRSRYNCSVPDFRRQSASAAASSVLASGHCSTSETPASASLLTLRSMVDAAASNTGGIGAT